MTQFTNLTATPIAIGIVINDQQEILVNYRTAERDMGDHWEFPGGKIEPGESVLAALIRELKEEVGITVTQAKPFMRFDFSYDHKTVDLNIWRVTAFEGEAKGQEGQPVQWVDLDSLKKLKSLRANRRIVAAIANLLSH